MTNLLEKEERLNIFMFNIKVCLISAFAMILLTILFEIAGCLVGNYTSSYPLFKMLTLMICSVLLYWICLNSTLNKWMSFILPLATSTICYIFYVLCYHFKTNFRYWGTGLGTEILTGLFIIFHFAVGLICGAIYFISWTKSRK